MKKSLTSLLILLILVSFNTITFAQKETKVGVSSAFEESQNNLITHSYGLTLNTQFDKHWGYEVGLNSKKFVYSFMDVNYISIPVAAKFNTDIVNLSVGIEANFYNNLKLYPNLSYIQIVSVDLFKLNYFTKISKQIELTSRFYFEPELRLNLFNPITGSDLNLGVGLNLRYKL